MLPGYGMERDDFARHGLIQAVHQRGWPVDVIAARPDLDLYLDGTVAERLHAEVVLPAPSAPPALWFLGVSLGAMGALLYAQRYPRHVAGVILLAPFLGTPGLIAEVAEAGGLAHWDPGGVRPADVERQLLIWLKDHRLVAPDALELYLGYGRGDRFARGAALLAQELPPPRVVLTERGNWRLTGAAEVRYFVGGDALLVFCVLRRGVWDGDCTFRARGWRFDRACGLRHDACQYGAHHGRRAALRSASSLLRGALCTLPVQEKARVRRRDQQWHRRRHRRPFGALSQRSLPRR